MIEFMLTRCQIREWRQADIDSLAEHANNVKVWRNLHDGFPRPYTRADAESWIKQASSAETKTHFAIAVDGNAVGGIGLHP